MKKRLNIRTIRKKIEMSGYHKLYKYEEKYLFKRLVKELDKYTSWIVRERDKGRKCVSYGIPVCKLGRMSPKNSQCCHVIKRAYYSHRRDLRNVYAGCPACNCYGKQDHDVAATTHVINFLGMEVREEMWNSRSMVKPKIREMEDRLQELKDILNKLQKKSCNL